ncbi:MAG: hypothetical protein U0V73_06260 [Acidimicrobiia bacterium]
MALVVLAINGVLVGGWALFAPRSFYDDFPGAGHHWVSVDGPYNEHLVRDVGAFYLALGVLALGALLWKSVVGARLAGVAWLVFSVPHLVYHLRHRDGLGTGDVIANAAALAIPIVAAVATLWPSSPKGSDR